MVTLKDISKNSGYSVSTISKALNGATDIPEATREKISDIAYEMGYIRNEYAANLSRKTSKNIAIIVRTDENYNYIDEISPKISISASFTAHSIGLDPITIYDDVLQELSERELEIYLKSKKITGIILFGIDRPKQKFNFLLNNNDFKKVLIDISTYNETTSSVSIDNLTAQYLLLNNLVKKHKLKKVLYLAGHPQSFIGVERTFGVNKFMQENPDVNVTIENSYFSKELAIDIINRTNLDEIDAVICANDLVAVNVKNYLLQKNIEMLVAGFDGLRLLEYMPYNIPTVNQDHINLAKLAVEELNRLMTNEDAEGQIIWDDYTLTY